MHEHHLVNEFYHTIKEMPSFSDGLAKLWSLMNDAWIQSAAFKHPSFASEKESRLMVSPFILNELAIGPRYHVAAGRIKKYYPLDLNRMCDKLNLHLSDLIGEIIIGPMSSQSVPILQDYLADICQFYASLRYHVLVRLHQGSKHIPSYSKHRLR